MGGRSRARAAGGRADLRLPGGRGQNPARRLQSRGRGAGGSRTSASNYSPQLLHGLTKVIVLNLDSRSYATFSTKAKDRVRRSRLIQKYGLADGIGRFAAGEVL